MIAYQYTSDGYYAGEIEDYGLLPNNATYKAPTIADGCIQRWNGNAWEQVENHKGERGWLNGEPHKIETYGPYPEGWSATPPEPTQEEKNAVRIAEIKEELANIDIESVRPLRAIAHNSATEDDTKKLSELEAQAEKLREELAALEV